MAGLLVMFVSPEKTAEPIEMPFGMRTLVGPTNHVLNRGADPPLHGAISGGCSPRRLCIGVRKMAESIDMPFVELTHVGPKKYALYFAN